MPSARAQAEGSGLILSGAERIKNKLKEAEMRKKVFGGLLAIVLIIGVFGVVFATNGIKTQFNTRHGTTGTVLDQCILCHATNNNPDIPSFETPPNPYGVALENNAINFATVEQVDSDSDGVNNIVEITRRTFPGNEASFPIFDVTLFDYDGDGITDISACHLPTNQFLVDFAGNLGQYGWGGERCRPPWQPTATARSH